MEGMNTATISRKLVQGNDDLVVIPRKRYEELVALNTYKEFTPTKSQLSSLRRAEKNFKSGKTLTYEQFAKKLGIGS